MIKLLLWPIVTDAINFIVLISVLGSTYQPEVKSCSPQLFGVGVGFCIYLGFFVMRNVFFMVCCYFTSKPEAFSYFGRYCGCMIDYFVLTGFTIWSTVALTS